MKIIVSCIWAKCEHRGPVKLTAAYADCDRDLRGLSTAETHLAERRLVVQPGAAVSMATSPDLEVKRAVDSRKKTSRLRIVTYIGHAYPDLRKPEHATLTVLPAISFIPSLKKHFQN